MKNKIMKYSYEKIEDNKSYVWHIEGDTKTLIAITDTTEKAHFLSTAANQFSSLSKEEGKDELIKNLENEHNSELIYEKQYQEIERLTGLIETAFNDGFSSADVLGQSRIEHWQQFAKENGLKGEGENK